ncbi:Putative indole-3-acetic acid-amido synthetase GH3.6 [Glycine soja]|uniref:Putative indole-3-acetic acid-amido synthetase GH3.6 n=1 Tax=Glycine soja TaxID=3848 RepID=A0A0B2SF72_GLYSO|nr:Putative indole-3-acetic acid-amido synthetase GH3.6 [Glycine soja]
MKPKLIPYFDSSLSKAASFIGHRGSVAVRQRLFPPRPEVSKILWFLYAENITTTKCGLKVMAASTYPLQSGNATPQQLAAFSSPLEVILGTHVEHQMYCHLLYGLRNLDLIDGITTPYAIGLIKAFGFLESKNVTTGSMKQYYQKLKYYAGEDKDVSKGTMDYSSVEVGKMYEVVVTTYRGYYRYRMGDIVRVVGFYNSPPLVEYVMRAPKNPAEIVTEKDLISAESMPKQLKVFVEVQEESNFLDDKLEESVKVLRSCISSLSSGLGAIYKVQRDKGQLRNLLIFIIRPGAFDQLSELAIKNGTSASQYKPPKIIRNHEVVKLLEKLAFVTVLFDG